MQNIFWHLHWTPSTWNWDTRSTIWKSAVECSATKLNHRCMLWTHLQIIYCDWWRYDAKSTLKSSSRSELMMAEFSSNLWKLDCKLLCPTCSRGELYPFHTPADWQDTLKNVSNTIYSACTITWHTYQFIPTPPWAGVHQVHATSSGCKGMSTSCCRFLQRPYERV